MNKNKHNFKSKEESIKKYLIDRKIAKDISLIEEVKGGIHNDVFHVKSDSGEIIYKKHLAVSKTFKNIILPPGRYENEKNSYQLLGKIVKQKIVPRLLYFDDKEEILILEYLGEDNRIDKKIKSLKPELFFEIGRVLAEISNKTYNSRELSATFNNSAFQELKYEYRYYKFIKNKKLYQVRDRLMEKARKNRVAFMHGDLRFNNIFVRNDSFYFIDFEGAFYADFALDPAYLTSDLLAYYYGYGDEKYKKMAQEFWRGFSTTFAIDTNLENLEWKIVKHAGFALLDKAIGVIKKDYSFAAPEILISKGEKIIVDDKIVKFGSLFID
ncbi:MAG: aminoglycoside phosphotransferase family protein [Patescibacteria group bacterium]